MTSTTAPTGAQPALTFLLISLALGVVLAVTTALAAYVGYVGVRPMLPFLEIQALRFGCWNF